MNRCQDTLLCVWCITRKVNDNFKTFAPQNCLTHQQILSRTALLLQVQSSSGLSPKCLSEILAALNLNSLSAFKFALQALKSASIFLTLT